jgi:hypothetical protein
MSGNANSGRKSIKLKAIEVCIDVQMLLQQLLYEHIQGNSTRDELEALVEERIKNIKVLQEEIERIKIK